MKQLLALFVLFLCSLSGFAQDVIVKNDGSTIVCRIVEVSSSEVVYKKWSDLNGSNYVMNRTDVMAINYENGNKDHLSAAAGTTITQEKQLTDMELIKMVTPALTPSQKVKRLRAIGWIGGGLILIGTGITMSVAIVNSETFAGRYEGLIWATSCTASVAWTTAFLLAANHYKKKTVQQQLISLWQDEIKFKNGTSLHAGVDVLKDNMLGNSTVGLGLRYNF